MDNKFIITISRGYGSGGKVIGKKLAKELKIPYYDSEILKMASEESGINEELFAKADEKLSGFSFLRAIPKKAAFEGGLISPSSPDFVSKENLFNYQAHVLRNLAGKESFIVIGRAADYILDGYPNLVKVHVYAPFDSCVKTVCEMFSLNKREAKKRIKTIDKERADFYKYYTGNKWDSPENYDLIINTSKTGWDNCAKLIKSYLKLKLKENEKNNI